MLLNHSTTFLIMLIRVPNVNGCIAWPFLLGRVEQILLVGIYRTYKDATTR